MTNYNVNLPAIFRYGPKRAMLAAVILVVGQAATRANTLSTNLSSPTAGTEVLSGDSWIAGNFRTDMSSYHLSSATLLISNSLPCTATLDLYSGVAQPNSFVGVLDSPGAYSASLAEATFTGDVALVSNSMYWLVLKADSGQFEWGWTENSDGSGVGFTHTWGARDAGGSAWFISDLEPMLFSMTASPSATVPEPSQVGLLVTGMSLLWWRGRRFRPQAR